MSSRKQIEKAQLKAIEELLQRPENQICADCKIRGPRWCSINIGCFLCIRCAGIHRKLGTHISKIKSTNLDVWQPDWIDFVSSMGNEKVNRLFFSRGSAPFANQQNDAEMEEYIRNKYEKKLYGSGHAGSSHQQQNHQQQTHQQPAPFSSSGASIYSRQLDTMAAMGFTDQAACIAALERSKGSIEKAVDSIVGKSPASGSPPKLESPTPASNPNAAFQIQLTNMGFSNLDSNDKAFQLAKGNMESTVAILIEWQSSGKRKSVDVPPSRNQQQATVPASKTPSAQQYGTEDLLDIFIAPTSNLQNSPFQQQQQFPTGGQGGGIPFPFQQNGFPSQNPFPSANLHGPHQQQIHLFQQQAAYSAPRTSFQPLAAYSAPQASFQPLVVLPSPQAPYQPQQQNMNPIHIQANQPPSANFQTHIQSNPYQPQQQNMNPIHIQANQPPSANFQTQIQSNPFGPSQEQQLPFVNPGVMLFQQPLKQSIATENNSNDDLFKTLPQPALTQFGNNNPFPQQNQPQHSLGAKSNPFSQQPSFSNNQFQDQSGNNGTHDPQEMLLQDQAAMFEQKKSREFQKDTILSMYRAPVPQQPAFVGGALGIQQGGHFNAKSNGFNSSGNGMMIPSNQGYMSSPQQQHQGHPSGFGYGYQQTNQFGIQQNNMNASVNHQQIPRQEHQASKPDLTGDIFKSGSQTNLNHSRVQDKNSSLLNDLNLFGK